MGDGGSAATRRATDRTARRCSAICCASTSTRRALRDPARQSVRGSRGRRGEIWAYGPAQSLALRVRPRDAAPLHRRRRAEPLGGDRRRAERRRGPQLRLERHGGSALLRARVLRHRPGSTMPAIEYGHWEGCSVTGGFVYRGRALPELTGHYFYSDYCNGWIRSFRWTATAPRSGREWRLPRTGCDRFRSGWTARASCTSARGDGTCTASLGRAGVSGTRPARAPRR